MVAALLPLFEALNQHYLKLAVEGVEHIPEQPALIVGNHSGGVMGPDLSCTLGTLWRARGVEAPLYMMTHDLAMRHLPPIGAVLARIGCLPAHPDHAVGVLARGGQVLVYPGGEIDAFRPFRRRNEIVFGPRTGFVRTAQRARVPIVPVVAEGAHVSSIVLTDGEAIARALGLSRRRIIRMPIALGLPWGIGVGPLPYLPLPFPIKLRFLPPISAPPEADPTSIRDEVVARMQSALTEMSRASA